MTGFEQDVIDRLARMETTVKDIQRAVNGNGHPGLIQQQSDLEHRVSALETAQTPTNGELGAHVKDLQKYHEHGNNALRRIALVVSWLITTAIAVYAAIRR